MESTALPAPTGAGRTVNRIAYVGLDGVIYTIAPDGSDRRQVSPSASDAAEGTISGRYTWPVWSPDADSLLFSGVTPGATGQGAIRSLFRAPASGSGPEAVVSIYRDESTTADIAIGTPHYSLWSPDGKKIALIAGAGSELATMVLDSESGRSLRPLARGAPVYIAWSPDSSQLMIHLLGDLTMFRFPEDLAGVVESRRVDARSYGYSSPGFSPSGGRYAFIDSQGDTNSLHLENIAGNGRITLTTSGERAAFRWSPDGSRLAVLKGRLTDTVYRELTIVEADGSSERTLVQDPMFSFWWSPDGTKLAFSFPDPEGTGGMGWSVVDSVSGEVSYLVGLLPTRSFEFALFNFDQYAHSHQIWSPDSRRIVLSGAILDEQTRARIRANDYGAVTPRVWVVDTSLEQAPQAVAEGFLGFWSPR